MSLLFVLAIILHLNLSKGSSPTDLAGILGIPLVWKTVNIGYTRSATCVINVAQTTWLLGGQMMGVDNDITNTATKQQFTNAGFTTLIQDEILQVPGSFPGQWVDSPGIYCKLSSQTSYGTFGNTQKMCYLGGNDGSSNTPQCACCSVEGQSGSRVRCDDLDSLNVCPPVFDSCVVNDVVKNRAIQIGGNTGTSAVTNVLCFDMSTEQYTLGVNTIERLQAETSAYDLRCAYGNLIVAAYDVGCDALPNDASGSIVVVGGRNYGSTTNGFLKYVQLCKNDFQDCQVLGMQLPQPTSQMRVLGLTNCLFIAFGGITQAGTNSEFYIGDICNQKWIYTQAMPASISGFSLVYGSNVLCLYGGFIDNTMQNLAYCTNFTAPNAPTTAKPTLGPTKRPTVKPTRTPTLAPTGAPTKPEQGTPRFDQGWSSVFQWDDGRDSQTCHVHKNLLFVLGGKNTAQKTLNTLSVFDYIYNKWEYDMYINASTRMTPFYCPHSCSGGYLNRVYLVNPLMDDSVTAARLFECTIDVHNNVAQCKDLCNSRSGTLQYCNSLLPRNGCVTTQDQFLYIIGGQNNVSLTNTITVFDMAKRTWASVPSNSPASSEFPTLFGNIATPVKNHACATWNFNIFIFGGQLSDNTATGTIQKCVKNGGDCTVQSAQLSVPRYYASADTIGDTVVVLCGAHDSQTLTDVVELYDVSVGSIMVDYSGSTSGLILDTPRRSCCVRRWDMSGSLVMNGGTNMDGSKVRSTSAAVFSVQDNDSGKPLAECNSISLSSTNKNFTGTYSYYSVINGYRVWTTSAHDSVIYYPSNTDSHTYVGNLNSQTWAFYPSSGFSTGYWTVIATQTTPQQNVYFYFDCLDSQDFRSIQSPYFSSSHTHGNLRFARLSWSVILVSLVLIAIIFAVVRFFYLKRQDKLYREMVIQNAVHDFSNEKASVNDSSMNQIFPQTYSAEQQQLVQESVEKTGRHVGSANEDLVSNSDDDENSVGLKGIHFENHTMFDQKFRQ